MSFVVDFWSSRYAWMELWCDAMLIAFSPVVSLVPSVRGIWKVKS